MQKPLIAEDNEKADRIMLLLMQPQVKTLLDSQPVGKKKAKNVQGMSTLPKEFINRPIIGPNNSTNLASLSPFKVDGVYYMQGRFGKQLKRVLGTDKLPILPPMCKLARLLMIKSHCIAHMSANDTCARSRHEAWIVRA